jgi:hypothetical protein
LRPKPSRAANGFHIDIFKINPVISEREACAKIADAAVQRFADASRYAEMEAAGAIGDAIRARSNPPR